MIAYKANVGVFLVLKTSAINKERFFNFVFLSHYSQEINSLHQLGRWFCEPKTTDLIKKQPSFSQEPSHSPSNRSKFLH
jgi:hypothetical protein